MTRSASSTRIASGAAAPLPVRVLVLRAVDGAGGGADQIILRNATLIDRHRVQMTVCFLRRQGDPDFDFDRRSADVGLEYREILHRGPFDRRVLPQLVGLARELQPQIIHSHDYKANFYATMLARQIPLVRLATSHGWTGDTRRERWVYYPADKLLLRRFPGVIAVSNQIRDTLLRYGAAPERVRVLLNGVDPAEFQCQPGQRATVRDELGYGPQAIVLGAIGRVEHQKRFDLLLSAFQRLMPHRPELRLLIAGDGSQLPALRRDVARRGLESHVRLCGHCPQIKTLYEGLDLLVQSSDYEGTPTVVVEAMAMCVPIVATDVGGTSQLITHEEHGLLVPRRQPDQLAAAIERTLDDPAATAQRVARARTRVEQSLSYRARLDQLEAIYLELAARGSLGRT